jgi:F0F1-type ATP synthase membrane subunit c/vacuolar-type H+-ATPase subunit K
MESETRLTRRAITGRAARRMFLRCCLAAIGAGYCATVASALGASAAARSSSPTTTPSPVLAGRVGV